MCGKGMESTQRPHRCREEKNMRALPSLSPKSRKERGHNRRTDQKNDIGVGKISAGRQLVGWGEVQLSENDAKRALRRACVRRGSQKEISLSCTVWKPFASVLTSSNETPSEDITVEKPRSSESGNLSECRRGRLSSLLLACPLPSGMITSSKIAVLRTGNVHQCTVKVHIPKGEKPQIRPFLRKSQQLGEPF